MVDYANINPFSEQLLYIELDYYKGFIRAHVCVNSNLIIGITVT